VQQAGVVALGVLASRISGFVRSVVVLAALGAGLLGDAYQTANVLPNVVFDLVLGGVLSSVMVPLLVAARHEHTDAGSAYTQRLLTLTVVVLMRVAALRVLAAPLLVRLYAHGFNPTVSGLTPLPIIWTITGSNIR
jgi:putative peptidoglycan lipid II flippase